MGSLVRSAISIGLQRDTGHTPGISSFDVELRRRLWYSIVELDLQASIEACMPPAVRPEQFDTLPPANVNDSDLVESMTDSPVPKEPDGWTDSSCQVVLAQSLVLRMSACHELWDVQRGTTYEDVLQSSTQLERLNDEVPLALKRQPATEDGQEGLEVLLHRVSLDVTLRRASIFINRHLVAQNRATTGSEAEERFASARHRLVKSANATLSDLEAFESEAYGSRPYRDLFWNLFKDDILHSAIAVCLELKTTLQGSGPSHGSIIRAVPLKRRYEQYSSNQASRMSKVSASNRLSHIRRVEGVIKCFVERIGELESNIKDALALALVLESVRFEEPRDKKQARMRDSLRTLIEMGSRKKCSPIGAKGVEAQASTPSDSSVPDMAGSAASGGLTQADLSYDAIASVSDLGLDMGLENIPFDLDWTFDQFWP